ncbi:hypothetical protein D3C72_1355230 [compost metagenome]
MRRHHPGRSCHRDCRSRHPRHASRRAACNCRYQQHRSQGSPRAGRGGRTRRPNRLPAGGRNIRSSPPHRSASPPAPSRPVRRPPTAPVPRQRERHHSRLSAPSARAVPSRSGRHPPRPPEPPAPHNAAPCAGNLHGDCRRRKPASVRQRCDPQNRSCRVRESR